jgi:hypothetical protein
MPYRYVPMLRAKAGEAIALQQLTPQAKGRMFPVFHLATAVSGRFAQTVGTAWAGMPLGLDGLFNFDHTGSGADTLAAFNDLSSLGVTVVPSVEYGAQAGYLAVVGQLAALAPNGLVVKVGLGNLPGVQAWLSSGGWQPQQVDLVVHAGHLADYGPAALEQLVLHNLHTHVVGQPWRSVSLSASSAPKDVSNLTLGPNLVPRRDWDLWQAVYSQIPHQLDYADFGISHPDMTEPPGYVMGSATVSVRYCLDQNWLVLKGRPVSGVNGIPMAAQYLGHAQQLVANRAFGGVPGCWGDTRIQQIQAGAINSGSRESWVQIGVNRHLSLVADRLP